MMGLIIQIQDVDACRTNCLASSCGDGVVDTGEGCDDGANNSNRTQVLAVLIVCF